MQIRTWIPNVLMSVTLPRNTCSLFNPEDRKKWIAEIKTNRVHTVLCLSEKKCVYDDIPIDLIHRRFSFNTQDPMHAEISQLVASDCLIADLPLVIDVSEDVTETDKLLSYLVEEARIFELRQDVERIMMQHCSLRPEEHYRQVTSLALQIYDNLQNEHNLASRYRSVLWASAMLHDIGTAISTPNMPHAWLSGYAILHTYNSETNRPNLIRVEEVATVAALHGIRKSTDKNPLGPVESFIEDLWPHKKIPAEVELLIGILRVADGLDYSLSQTVKKVHIDNKKIFVEPRTGCKTERDRRRALEKSFLLSSLLGVEVSMMPG